MTKRQQTATTAVQPVSKKTTKKEATEVKPKKPISKLAKPAKVVKQVDARPKKQKTVRSKSVLLDERPIKTEIESPREH